MKFLDRILGRKASTPDQIVRAYLAGATSASGMPVNEETAYTAAAVYSCIRVIAETVASLPLQVYERLPDGGKQRAENHPLWDLLTKAPNAWQTPFEFRELLQGHLLLRGNAYAAITWVGQSVAKELIPLHPDRVTVEQRPDFSLVYKVARKSGAPIQINQEDMLHLRGLSSDGVTGRAPLEDARDAIGLALATQRYGARVFKNNATPAVVITHPSKLSPEARNGLREQWDDIYSGTDNAARTAVLAEGMKVEKLSMTAEDAQFLETRKFSRSEIAGIFRVPPHMIGDLDRATFGNIEHQSIEFVTHCIRPWLVRWEQALSMALFTAPGKYFPEHNVDALLRGDIKSRYEAYAIGRTNGWLSANEIRSWERLNPIPGGDTYIEPMNTRPLGTDNGNQNPASGG